MTRSRAIAAGSNWLAFAAALAVAFALTPHLIRSLGQARYDVWCVVEAVLAYFTLLDLGVGVCLVRAAARCRSDTGELNRVASASLAIFSAAGLIALLIGVPLTLIVAPRIGLRDGDPQDATLFMMLMLINLAMTLPLSVFGSILEGKEAFVSKSIVRVVMLAVKSIAYLTATWESGTLVPLAVISLIVTLLESGMLAFLCYRFVPALRFRVSLIDRQTLHDVRGYSWHAFLAMLAGRITLQTGAILIGLFLPTGLVTAFATAARLVDYAKTLLRTVTATLTPGIAAMESAGDWAGIRELILKSTTVTLSLALPINLGLIVFGHPFLTRWVGAEIADRAAVPLMILSATMSIGVVQSVASRVLYGLGRLRWFARLALIESAVNVLLTLLLIQRFELIGVALAVAIPNVLFCVATIVIACRSAGIDGWSFWRAIRRPMICSIPLLITWWLTWKPEANYGIIFFTGLAGCMVYGVSLGLPSFTTRISVAKRTGFVKRISIRHV